VYRLQWEERLSSRNSNINAIKNTKKYCGLTIRADANSDDVRVMKNAMKMAYFNRFSAYENHSVLCAL